MFLLPIGQESDHGRKSKPLKKDKDRRKGKGRRFCLGGRIYSIPCRTSCFEKDNFEQ